jgi:mRNA interferase HicA
MYDFQCVNGHEFQRRLAKLGKQTDNDVRFDAGHGQGSHGTIYYGSARTTLKDRRKEIPKGLLHAMLKQLGIDPKDF